MSASDLEHKKSKEDQVTISKQEHRLFLELKALLLDRDFMQKLETLLHLVQSEELYLGEHTEDLASASVSRINEWADEENDVWDEM